MSEVTFAGPAASDRILRTLAEGRPSSDAVLLAVGGLLHREVAIDDLLGRLVDQIRGRMNADRGTIYLLDRAKGELVSRAAHLPELEEIRLALGQGVAGHVAASGEVINVPTTEGDAKFYPGVDARTGYRTESILAVPMRDRRREIIGVIQLLNKKGGRFPEEDATTLSAMAEQAALAVEATTLYAELARPAPDSAPLALLAKFNGIVGNSEPLRRACRLVAKAAPTEATVLIRGESGTGKELFARALHVNSPRSDGPFVKVDCAALPATLIENELFGHVAGAYTGADALAAGRFDAARGGTVFLDEIGELPIEVQGKLLRVLQDRAFDRVGGTSPIQADVRVVAATNRDLASMVDAGTFRSDLYYRIRVVEVVLPPLRERGAADITRLAEHFLVRAAKRHGRSVPRLSSPARDRLASHAWPGNVRELENCLESAIIVMDGNEIEPEDLPLVDRTRPARAPSTDVTRTLEEVERAHVLAVLDSVEGNRTVAAKRLGIGRNTLGRKLKEWGL